MRIEKVSEDKLKVLIDGVEAKAWNLSFGQIAKNSPQVQKLFQAVLHFAEKNVDFSVSGAKLFIEALQEEVPQDGFGMMITCVRSENQLQAAISACPYEGRIKRTLLEGVEERGELRQIYRFLDFEALCRGAELLHPVYRGESVLYKCDGAFYLYLTVKNAQHLSEVHTLLSEFGSRVKNGQYVHGRLNEYGEKMIAENAVGVMQEYFCVK